MKLRTFSGTEFKDLLDAALKVAEKSKDDGYPTAVISSAAIEAARLLDRGGYLATPERQREMEILQLATAILYTEEAFAEMAERRTSKKQVDLSAVFSALGGQKPGGTS